MLSKEELDKFVSENGGAENTCHVVGKDGKWEIIFKKPSRAQYKVFRARANNPATKSDAQELILRECIVYPKREDFDALLDRFPGISESEKVSEGMAELVGMTAEDSAK